MADLLAVVSRHRHPFVALLVWYAETRDDWENNLPKWMSVFFFYRGRPVIICHYVWLAGAGDMRAWGQQVARQTVEGQQLDFSPDIEARTSLEVWPSGTVCKHYAVCFTLTKRNPFLTGHPGECRYQNLAAEFKEVRPVPLNQAEALRVVADW
ncbi:MAG TPA: hypothetical protein VLB04_01545 [Methanotrichaceae archaeon]|nr:hypothetical protein [Methanotrichaceae archaeon]